MTKTWSWRDERNSPLVVASLRKLSMLSVLILNEQQKKSCYTGNQTYPINQKGDTGHKYNHILSEPVLKYQLVHKSLVHISCDANSRS